MFSIMRYGAEWTQIGSQLLKNLLDAKDTTKLGLGFLVFSVLLPAVFNRFHWGGPTVSEWLKDGWNQVKASAAIIWLWTVVLVIYVFLFLMPQMHRETTASLASALTSLSDYSNKVVSAKKDFIDEHRPRLEPKLIIDSVNTNSVAYHFEVENKGRLTASAIAHQISGENFLEAQHDLPFTNRLFSGAQITIRPQLPVQFADTLWCELVLTYRAIGNNSDIPFNSMHRFSVPRELINPGAFMASVAQWDSKIIDKAIQMDALKLPHGTMAVELIEADPDTGRLNEVKYTSTDRAFHFDPASRLVTFRSTASGNQSILVRTLKKTGGGWHRIVLVWDSDGAGLIVDGVHESHPPNSHPTNYGK